MVLFMYSISTIQGAISHCTYYEVKMLQFYQINYPFLSLLLVKLIISENLYISYMLKLYLFLA